VTPFHWELEYPEVFDGVNPGFDCIVGNPPFMGGTKISTSSGASYFAWLGDSFDKSGNRMDLVGYFFRVAYTRIRAGGTLGFVATNTIAQGDTRTGTL